METKDNIHINGTKKKGHAGAILLTICIVILIGVAAFLGYMYYKEKRNAVAQSEIEQTQIAEMNKKITSLEEEKTKLEQQTHLQAKDKENFKMIAFDPNKGKIVFPGVSYRLSWEERFADCFRFDLEDNNELQMTIFRSSQELASYVGVKDPKDIVISKDTSSYVKIKGIDKKIVDLKVQIYGQQLSNMFLVLLYEDGTCGYSDLNTLATQAKIKGTIKDLSNIQKIYLATTRNKSGDGGSNTIIAIDKDNNFYDVGYMLKQSGEKLGY